MEVHFVFEESPGAGFQKKDKEHFMDFVSKNALRVFLTEVHEVDYEDVIVVFYA